MKAMKLTFVVGLVLVSTSPAFSHFVKAALGFRIGHSPTESRYGQSAYNPAEKKAVGVQMLSGVNNGRWKGPIQAASSNGYGVGIAQDSSGRSYGGGGGPLDAHTGNSAVKHLRILGLNLYLGGRAANNLGHGIYHKPQLAQKQLIPLVNQPYLAALTKPVTLGAGVGAGLKPLVGHAPNGGKIIGGQGGVRAAVSTPGFGVGFNLGYRQGINTKSPLGLVFGLGGPGKGYYAPVQKGPIYKGQDQLYIPGGGILKGHGHHHGLSHSPVGGGQNQYGGYPYESNLISGLESKHHFNTQQVGAASNNQNHGRPHHQYQQASQQQYRQQGHGKHQGLQGPMSYPSYSSNPFIAFLQGRPSMLRPTRLQYNFNNPQSSPSGPIRTMFSRPPTPAPQRPRHAGPQEVPPQGWSTLYPVAGHGPHPSASNAFVNPLPANGQPLAKLQASLRPGNPFQYHQHAPVSSAQNQIPFVQQSRQNAQPPQQFQTFFSQPLPNQAQFTQPRYVQPQNSFQQYFSNGFQQQQAAPAPQISQDFNFFQQNGQGSGSLQSFSNHPQANFQQSSISPQQTSFFNQIQEQPVQAETQAQSKQSPFENNPEIPFNPEATPFAPEPGYQYSHTDVSEPMKMGSFTMNMDLGSNSAEPNQASSSLPMFGPLGRRLKKAKKPRSDGIVKKQGTPEPDNASKQYEMLETSASSNFDSITMASSLGSTSWTPIINMEVPQIQKKSLESPVFTSVQVVEKKQPQQQPQQEKKIIASSPTGSSAILTAPAPSLGPAQGPQSDRTMILKKRRLNVSGEMLNAPTVIPFIQSSAVTTTTTTTTTAAPSTSSSTTTTTTTVVPPSSSSSAPSSSSSAPSSSSSSAPLSSSSSPVTVPESTSQSSSSEPVTTTTVVSV